MGLAISKVRYSKRVLLPIAQCSLKSKFQVESLFLNPHNGIEESKKDTEST